MRQVLPRRRAAETFDLRFWNQLFTVTVGFYPDGTPAEVFVDIAKSGADIAGIARDVGVVISLALVEIETLRHAVTRDARGGAASLVGAVVDALIVRGAA